ncbi:MAG: hypothetical protein DRI86_04220 [Bacteroidetes bacterium]|nr:MAG: hypothetical protein DRI86_04220 [Bacteroidota bacterium]
MRVRNIIYILFGVFFGGLSLKAQTYLISDFNNQTISTCSGTFYDSGDSTGNYSTNESYTVTIGPGTNSTYIHIVFNSFNVGIGDQLEVYDGANTSAQLIAIFNNGNNPVGYTLQPSFFNFSAKLTLKWTSVTSSAGWDATLSCGYPCQNFNTTLVYSNPPYTIDSGIYFIDICPGDSVELLASASFGLNDIFYHQDTNTTNFTWNFGPNININGQAVSAVFNNAQGYNAYIIATDTIGCHSSQSTEVRIRVSTLPTFTGTDVLDNTICQNDSTILSGIAHPTRWQIIPSLSVAGTTFLPDGTGVSYTSDLVFSGFPTGQSIQQVSDIVQIFAEMEHSYLGDLNIIINCPNNSAVTLKSFPGAADTFLGEPIDDSPSTPTPGLGYMYHWKASGTTTMVAAASTYTHDFTDVLGTVYTNQSFLPPSTVYPLTSTASSPFPIVEYLPETPFTNLVGCPLNGTWSITVTDNLAIDNGFIFSWGIDFNPALFPVAWGYTPVIDTTYWNYGSGDTTSYTAFNAGMQAVNYTMVDGAGCTYDTSITIMVNPLPDINIGNDTSICIYDFITLKSGIDSVPSNVIWNNGISADSITVNPVVSTLYSLVATSTDGCVNFDSIEVAVNPLPHVVLTDDTLLCVGRTMPITASGGDLYEWNTGETTSSIYVSPTNNTTYFVTVTDSNACISDAQMDVIIAQLPQIVTSNDTTICDGTSTTIWASGGVNYFWSTGNQGTSQTVNPLTDETYTVAVQDSNTCIDSADVIVEILENPDADIYADMDTVCERGSVSLTGVGGMSYIWENKYLMNTYKDTPKASKRYHVKAINIKNGTECYDTASFFVYVEHCAVYNASAFTPNGDGLNDTYGPIGIVGNTAKFEFIIFNKWGKVVFSTKDKNEKWNGKVNGVDAPDGVYTYVVRVAEPSIEPYELMGTVTLIR